MKQKEHIDYFECNKAFKSPNHTDVCFIGLPSSGKTCMYMGLLSSGLFRWNADKSDVAEAGFKLRTLCEKGIRPERTISNTLMAIDGYASDFSLKKSSPVTIYDCNGDSLLPMVDNYDPSLSSMKNPISNILTKESYKILFILVDPDDDMFTIQVKGANGCYSHAKLSQKLILSNFLSILSDFSNDDVMKKVLAINFIVTKSDLLDEDRSIRMEKAKELMSVRYMPISRKLTALCRKYNIDDPLVFTFSLGQFYMGSVFDYDCTDSDALISSIAELCYRPNSDDRKWYNRVRSWFSKH